MRRAALKVVCVVLLALVLGRGAVSEEELPRSWEAAKPALEREPAYVAQPLYALFLFGDEKEVGVWAVLDKSSRDVPHYDVLHFDRDADGDLTDEGERITAKWNERMARAGMGIDLRVGEFGEPGTDIVHTNIRVSTVRKPGRKGIWVKLKVRDRHWLSGGQTINGDCTEWGKSPEEAPVLRPCLSEPFSFGFWAPGMKTMTLGIGRTVGVNLMAGIHGSKPDTLLTVDEDFFDPEKDKIALTLIAKGVDGEPIEETTYVTGHC